MRAPHGILPPRSFLVRGFLVLGLVATGVVSTGLVSCGGPAGAEAGERRVIVLGFDGLDHELTEKLMAEGRLPNFSRLAEGGGFAPLGTSVPPQSPVAWSDFITGMDSGGHGIYDFVHRDPSQAIPLPYLSTSRVEEADEGLTIGKWQIPLSGGSIELLRRGVPFWEVLEDHGVETTIVRMPANFPPSGTATRELSGMGTPDILGTYGTFSFYTSELFAFSGQDVSGGEVYEVWPENGVVRATLYGPNNPFLVETEKVSSDFTVTIDPDDPVVLVQAGDERRVIGVGEWTDWVPVEFDLIPTQKLHGMVRFYLESLEPEFELYVTPVNIDPLAPALPISTPKGWAGDLARSSGRFYTQGMPEDTKALENGVFDLDDFVAQARITGDEIIDQYEDVLAGFDEGLLFYYFGNADQISHMLWHTMDPEHPSYDPEVDPRYADVIPSVYERLDGVVGYTLANIRPDDLLIVMSDHGFASWRRTFNLNTWLYENGYLAVRNPDLWAGAEMYGNVDWSQTQAYGLGINGLYINLEGRETNGIVPPSEREDLMRKLRNDLLDVVDPKTGDPIVTKVYLREEIYRDRGHLEIGPDLIVGYAKGARCSNDSTLGTLTPEIFGDNLDEWTGDHEMDHETVPGILLSNRPLRREAPDLRSLASAILFELGVDEEFPRKQS